MQSPITREEFDDLLDWLDSDRETAGMKYEQIRQDLMAILNGEDAPMRRT